MDTLSHALWGRGLFGYRGYKWWALFWGAAPDLFSFGILFLIRIISFEFSAGKPDIATIPWWVFINYDISHSFISATIVIGMVWRVKKQFAFAMLGWPFHICLDFPFHSKEFFPTKLLWPLTDFSFNGIPWNHPEVWLPNIAGIIILFIWRYLQNK
ncbi:MAG: hypothetical protein CMG57_02200 [Candidatus Marinimicrobia bacterium]|nr:hypothetical protein [Candidatus Neomarinimicrobiota bacterium]|tara:strand:- start:1308 stop:1775 length:468 start_codon:yes stop_codon:yes gene_type:complete